MLRLIGLLCGFLLTFFAVYCMEVAGAERESWCVLWALLSAGSAGWIIGAIHCPTRPLKTQKDIVDTRCCSDVNYLGMHRDRTQVQGQDIRESPKQEEDWEGNSCDQWENEG